MLQRFDPTIKGIVLLALLVLVEGIQLVILAGLISFFCPIKTDPFNFDIFPVYQSSIRPSRQMLIYHIFIMASILAQAALVYAFRKKLEDKEFQHNIKQLLCADALWVSLQLFAVFKILVYNSPAWGWGLFYISLAGSVLSRVFWVELVHGWDRLEKFLKMDSRERGRIQVQINDLWFPLFILVEAAQAAIAFNFLWGHAKPVSPFLSYIIFMAGMGACFMITRVKKDRLLSAKPFIAAETIITFFLLSALFKMVIYDYRNQLATNAYHVLLVLAVVNKIFWPRLWRVFQAVWALMTDPRNTAFVRMLGDIFFAVFIVMTIYIPDPQAVLAKMFIGDEFIHTNCFIMAPGWAYVKGCLLDVDVMSRYGLGIPIVLGPLAQAMGGYNYLNVFLVIMWICIIYYLLCYLFLRLWLKSFILAVAAILVGIKTQLFYTLSFPQPFTYSSATPARFMLDIIFMLFIWGHLKTRRWEYLLLAALCAGVSFFCVPETGLYLSVSFYAYLVLLAMVPAKGPIASKSGPIKGRAMTALCVLTVPASAGVLMWSYLGRHLWTKEFWDNFTEISKLYTAGFWMGPFNGGLQYGQFWDLLVGMSFPLVYVLTILIIGTLCVLRKIPNEHLMAVVLCFYGLGAHHYYVVMATANNYYPRGLPFVFIIFYWVGWFLSGLSRDMRRAVGGALVAFCAYCLWTNHHYLSYPNMFNFSRNPMIDPLVAERLPDRGFYFNHRYLNGPESFKLPLNSLGEKDEDLRTEKDFTSDEELKSYYKKETDFSKDVRLIQSFLPPGQPAALLSSYETEILMQADRKPFFYYFRVFQSRPLRMRNFGSLDIWTTKELNKLINQIQSMRPTYVFMERIFLKTLTPTQYTSYDPALMGLLDYVKKYYQPYAYGKFLVAMKRKDR